MRSKYFHARLRRSGICLCVAMAVFPAAAEQTYYRYKNAQGNLVIDHSIPAEFAKKGYSVITPSGKVIKEVPPQMEGEALKKYQAQEERRRQQEEEAERLRKWDESLLLRYSSVEDIEAARDRKLKEIKVRIDVLKGNLLATKTKIEQEQEKAANIERRGQKVPPVLTENIAIMQAEVGDMEISIQSREEEKIQVTERYQKDIERFKLLLQARGGQLRR